MKSLLEAGVHFGHRTRRWNPKMKRYIFTERNGIHIIDLQQTMKRLDEAYELVKNTVSSGGVVLFVGTKKQAQESVAQEAARCGMPFINQRWLGGTLTNWRTIRQRIDYMLEIERQQARGEFARLTKKEALMREREINRLNHRMGGLRDMRRLPNLLFVVDVRRDTIAVKEANILGIPIIAMVDTNCDPDPIDYVIPSNDDAIRAIKLMNSTMASAVLEGQAILSSLRAEEDEVAGMEEEEALERYLGPSTLAKIQAEYADDDEEDYETLDDADVDEAEVEDAVEEVLIEVAETVAEADIESAGSDAGEEDTGSAAAEPVLETVSEESSSEEVVEEETKEKA
ncbi:MAG: 30S ribosomal protein S2 [Anaerolineae bacterium]|nr:30S ribosomal protein S2 [Anaerolineae bacterium]MCB9108406.1 30S ribosomal protein S2 [Anaerolineales bacterium]